MVPEQRNAVIDGGDSSCAAVRRVHAAAPPPTSARGVPTMTTNESGRSPATTQRDVTAVSGVLRELEGREVSLALATGPASTTWC